MYRDVSPELLEIVEPIAVSHGLEIVDAQRSGVPGRGLRLRVILDTPQGDGRVTIEDCARVSREIGHGLDATGVMAGSYVLEVSSPGVDRVLGRWIDFERSVGREVWVETRDPIEGRRRFRGALLSCAEERLEIRLPEGPCFQIPFAQVARAKAFYASDAKAKR